MGRGVELTYVEERSGVCLGVTHQAARSDLIRPGLFMWPISRVRKGRRDWPVGIFPPALYDCELPLYMRAYLSSNIARTNNQPGVWKIGERNGQGGRVGLCGREKRRLFECNAPGGPLRLDSARALYVANLACSKRAT